MRGPKKPKTAVSLVSVDPDDHHSHAARNARASFYLIYALVTVPGASSAAAAPSVKTAPDKRLVESRRRFSRGGQQLNLLRFWSSASWIRLHIERDSITLAGQVL
jgi:hypothetical protein